MRQWVMILALLVSTALPAQADITSNLVSHWDMDAGTGTTVTDSVGSNTLTFLSGSNAPSWLTSASCKRNNCISIADAASGDSNADGLTCSFATGSTFTLTGWIWADSTLSANDYSPLWVDSGGNGLYLRTNAGADSGKLDWYQAADNHSTNPLTYNTWQHIAVTNNAGSLTFYLNGTANGTASSINGLTIVQVGVNPGFPNEQFKGRLDHWFLYSRALSTQDILDRITADNALGIRRRPLQY